MEQSNLDAMLAPPQPPTPKGSIVMFGATGDLVTDHGVRDALGNLVAKGQLEEGRHRLIFTSRRAVPVSDFLADLQEGDEGDPLFSKDTLDEISSMSVFAPDQTLLCVDLADSKPLKNLPEFSSDEVVLYYGALPPAVFSKLVEILARAGAMADSKRHRLVLEKPFGEDLASARKLEELLRSNFQNEQLYLVDHFLMYPGMLEWLSLRCLAGMDALLGGEHACPDKGLHLILYETIMSNDRAYFRETGIMEDMLQNHAMQILANVCTNLNKAGTSESWREARLEVFRALRWTPGDVTVAQVEGFNDPERGAPRDSADSQAETLCSIGFTLDLERWKGVPLRMTAAKGVNEKRFGFELYFRSLPRELAERFELPADTRGRLAIDVRPARFRLITESGEFELQPPREQSDRPAYSRVFLDALHGNQHFFVDPRESVAAWEFIQKVQDGWSQEREDMKTYPKGSSVADLLKKYTHA